MYIDIYTKCGPDPTSTVISAGYCAIVGYVYTDIYGAIAIGVIGAGSAALGQYVADDEINEYYPNISENV